MRHATIELVASSEALLRRLGTAKGLWNVVIETFRERILLSGQTAPQLAQAFQGYFAAQPNDLLFRAYTTDQEIAWLGLAGVVVTVGTDGEYTVENAVYRANKNAITPALNAVEELFRGGRLIYRKLTPPGEGETMHNEVQ